MKKLKTTSQSPSQSQSQSILHRLTDDVLVKIFDHLPSQPDVVRCTVVCKHWCSLISTNFIKCSSIHHHQFENSSFTFLVQVAARSQLEVRTSNPFMKLNSSWSVEILASFNDLLLYREWPRPVFESFYLICNPVTKQQLRLPSAPLLHYYNKLGLLCYPTNNAQYRYTVLSVPAFRNYCNKFLVEIFNSEIGCWKFSVVSSPCDLKCGGLSSEHCMVPYNGILHWISDGHRRVIVAYDPRNDKRSCRVIDMPAVAHKLETELLGVSRGMLLLLQLISYEMGALGVWRDLHVWELEDYNEGKWGCRRKVNFIYGNPQLLGFHPYDADVIYFNTSRGIFSYNLAAGTCRVASELHQHDKATKKGFVLQLVHPWWPTPAPTLLS